MSDVICGGDNVGGGSEWTLAGGKLEEGKTATTDD